MQALNLTRRWRIQWAMCLTYPCPALSNLIYIYVYTLLLFFQVPAVEQVREMEKSNDGGLGKGKPLVWDCGSSLYDSFELNSFNRQLDSAIASRTLSMSHLSDRRAAPPPPTVISLQHKKSSKISRSLQKLVRSVFKPKPYSDVVFAPQEKPAKDGRIYILCAEVGALSSIREAPEVEFGDVFPEISSFSRKTASARFSANSIGISCA